MAYPRRGSQLFIENANEQQAVLGHPFFTSKYYEYEIAYKVAADTLVESSIKTDGIFSCVCIYPIAFLYRQFLELRLKDILWKYYPNFEKVKATTGGNLSGSHNLYLLWKKLREYFENCSCTIPEQIKGLPRSEVLEAVEDLIAEMRIFDRNSEAFRYPFSKKNTKSFPNMISVDLENLKERMNELANFLAYIEEAFLYIATVEEPLNKQ